MSIIRNLSKLAAKLSSSGVVSVAGGGLGITDPGASGNVPVSDGAGNWVSTAGGGGGGGAMALLQTVTVASPVASVALTAFNNTLYNHYRVVVEDLAMSADWASVGLQLSTDGGVTPIAGSNYSYETNDRGAGAGSGNSASVTTGTSYFRFMAAMRAVGNTPAGCGDMDLLNIKSVARYVTMMSRSFVYAPDNTRYIQENFGMHQFANLQPNAVVLNAIGGNISVGIFKLYGIT